LYLKFFIQSEKKNKKKMFSQKIKIFMMHEITTPISVPLRYDNKCCFQRHYGRLMLLKFNSYYKDWIAKEQFRLYKNFFIIGEELWWAFYDYKNFVYNNEEWNSQLATREFFKNRFAAFILVANSFALLKIEKLTDCNFFFE
jgi:hypothetical protein